ncbi:hypothetical protein [Roseitalea sp. MMSF_3504]|uniref:hypothetical protein n=1 Tax=Roseitalea sp. MMSF_3504 TaxID=3046716 RepID=UPI00273E3DDD|nr:hypothetical protein [Roseitalea sp. MMSF_3504]
MTAQRAIRLRHLSRLRIIGLILVLLATLVLGVFYFIAQDRSFLAEFETFSAEVAFTDDTARNTWSLAPGTLLCRLDLGGQRRETDGPGAEDDNRLRDLMCEPASFDAVETDRTLAFRWPQGAMVVVHAGPGGSLIADIEAVAEGDGIDVGAGAPLAKGDRIVLPPEPFYRSGSLPFSGQVRIGAEAGAGQRGYLVAGHYVIRQTLPGRDNPLTVASGQLNRGDRVGFRFSDDRGQGAVYGFISAYANRESQASNVPFHLVAYTALGRGEMTINRFANRTTVIKPEWTDRAINDPWLIGATVVLTLAALCAGILADSMAHFPNGQREAGAPDESSSSADIAHSRPPEGAKAGEPDAPEATSGSAMAARTASESDD